MQQKNRQGYKRQFTKENRGQKTLVSCFLCSLQLEALTKPRQRFGKVQGNWLYRYGWR